MNTVVELNPGSVVMVTGGGSGSGAATARICATSGASFGNVAAWLLSEGASYVTGQTSSVEGGSIVS